MTLTTKITVHGDKRRKNSRIEKGRYDFCQINRDLTSKIDFERSFVSTNLFTYNTLFFSKQKLRVSFVRDTRNFFVHRRRTFLAASVPSTTAKQSRACTRTKAHCTVRENDPINSFVPLSAVKSGRSKI